MAAAAILNFGKNVNNFGLDKDISHQIIWEDAPRRRGDDHGTKNRNRKLIRVTSSNEGLKQLCVDLSDYNRYLNQIWHRTQIPHCQQARMPNSYKLRIQDGGGRHFKFRKNVNNFGLDKDILHQIIWEDAPRRRGDDHVTKSRNRK